MKVVANNCISKIKIPRNVESVHGFDYNPVLDLFATFSYDYDGVSVWNPVSGEVVAEFEDLGENFRDTLFLPGDRVGISSSEPHHGGTIEIFSLGKNKSDSGKLEIDDLPVSYPGALALSPEKTLLVTDPFSPGEGVHEILIDWDNLKVLKSRQIILGNSDNENPILLLCCSRDFQVSTFVTEASTISTAKVRYSSEGKVHIEEEETITYYMLGGEETGIGEVIGLVHDGQNLIIADGDEIVLLESMTEGSKAHLIASDVKPSGQMRINCEGQLMVCEEKVIKLFEYNCNPRSLQHLCRHNIRKTICTDYRDKVDSLEIPSILKDLLLYK